MRRSQGKGGGQGYAVIRSRWVIVLGLSIAAVVGFALVSWHVVETARFRTGLARARREAGSGGFAEARRWLATLPPSRASDPEAADLLGTCEHAAGRYEAALAAWSRIPRTSPFAARTDLARAKTLAGDLGRFADAELILQVALRAGGPDQVEVRHTLGQLYFWEFRRTEMRRLIRAGWKRAPDPASELRDLWLIDDATTMIDPVREVVETAARLAPDDDRVWLARAGLEAASGRFDAAARWLDRCTKRRPDDPAVWLARLDLARAREDAEAARLAYSHLPPEALSETESLDLRAWLSARLGDHADEREALTRRVNLGPAETRPLERLAVLAWEAGEHDHASALRRRKAELDHAKDRYRRLLQDNAPSESFAELGQLAEVLDRKTEAEGWWTLAYRGKPGRPDALEALARLHERPDERPSSVLADQRSGRPSLAAKSRKPEATTAGVSVDFRDDSGAAGLRFVFENGRSRLRQLPETTAGGVGLLDYDGDGWLDVYLPQGGAFPPGTARPNRDRLFRNRGDGTFEDATGRSGIDGLRGGYGHGIAVGDYDNDGDPDVFLTRWGSYALYRNRGDGTFEDLTDEAGLGGDRDWPTSAAFADLDNDGDLDLYVCHYLVWDAAHPTLCPGKAVPAGTTEADREYGYCMPNPFPSLPDHLFRNDGGRFVDVTAESGIVETNGRGLGVVAADVDGDGRVDLFVANDTTANALLHNLGGMKFEEVGVLNGVACNADGAFQAGMGTACGDLDGDGRPDLLVTNFYGESTTFFRNLGDGVFGDQTASVGLAAASRFLLGFGIALFDANNDGRLDLATANGHVNDDRPRFPYAMPAQLLIGGPDGRLTDVTAAAGAPWSVLRVGRGLAVGDLDNDGRIDALMVDQAGPLAYFHNLTENTGHFLTLRLVGGPSNRDAVGAVVTVKADGRVRRAWRAGGGSFLSASDPRIHAGLGASRTAETVEVRWPSGRTDRWENLAADRGYELREGGSSPTPLSGFRPR